MQCPNCKAKISLRHYDPIYEWFECPKCEGCFTPDEIEEAANGTSPAKRRATATKAKPVAKKKRRQSQEDEDAEALAEFEKEAYKTRKQAGGAPLHRDAVTTANVVQTWAAELQDIFDGLGSKLDDVNAQDKALTLWRTLHITNGVTAREKELPLAYCREHDSA